MADPTDTYTVEQFMADARETYARFGSGDAGRAELGMLLQRLASAFGALPEGELAALHGGQAAATILHSDGPDDLTLMLAQFTTPTSVHDHGSWGVACVVQGRDGYQEWDVVDPTADSEHAALRMLGEREVGPGEVVTWSGPPHDLHAQRGVDGPAWELILFGRDVSAIPRRYFDPDTGAVRTALPQ